MTPNARRTRELVVNRYGVSVQTFNCRKWASGKGWSQHAASEPAKKYYSNALDLFHHDKRVLDEVASFLRANKNKLHINRILWGVKDHYDHIHVEFWPMMRNDTSYVPPCKGGKLVVIHEDGSVGNTFDEEEKEMTIGYGDKGNTVSKIQKGLNGWYNGSEPLAVDGDFGAKTVARTKEYQEAADLLATGEVDGITMALLMEYVPDWIDNHTTVSGNVTVTGTFTGEGVING